MSDYARAGSGGATHFGDKDGKTTGDVDKIIVGGQFDDEYNAILTAVNSKYDSADLASQAAAQAGTNNTTLMTPLRAEEHMTTWAAENDAMITDIHALNLSVDAILAWDQSATSVKGWTLASGSGLSFTSSATLDWAASGLSEHDNFADFVSDEHVLHAGVTITAGTGMTGGGNISSTRTLNVIGGDGITANADDIAITDAAATATNPIGIASGVFNFDIDGLTTMQGNALAATDTFIVSNGSVDQGIEVQDLGFRVQSGQSSQTLALADMNTIMEFNGTATITIPINSGVALPIGAAIIIVVDHATQVVTVTAASSVTLNSTFHPGGGAAASDTVRAGGTAVLLKTAADEWYLSGDIAT